MESRFYVAGNLKVSSTSAIPNDVEIIVLPDSQGFPAYPCLDLFTGSSRLLRPVQNLNTGSLELTQGRWNKMISALACAETLFTDMMRIHMRNFIRPDVEYCKLDSLVGLQSEP